MTRVITLLPLVFSLLHILCRHAYGLVQELSELQKKEILFWHNKARSEYATAVDPVTGNVRCGNMIGK